MRCQSHRRAQVSPHSPFEPSYQEEEDKGFELVRRVRTRPTSSSPEPYPGVMMAGRKSGEPTTSLLRGEPTTSQLSGRQLSARKRYRRQVFFIPVRNTPSTSGSNLHTGTPRSCAWLGTSTTIVALQKSPFRRLQSCKNTRSGGAALRQTSMCGSASGGQHRFANVTEAGSLRRRLNGRKEEADVKEAHQLDALQPVSFVANSNISSSSGCASVST